jgi:superfamily I DNA/RNA helicase/mRNA-degrading endonuclease RelE of RelBE toxin-antitoxin system
VSGTYDLQITRDFLRQLHSFDSSVFRKWQRIGSRFYSDPFHPSLQTEQIHHAEDGIYSARLDDNYRLIFKLVKPTTVILAWVDTHDKAYAKARRISIVLQDGMVRIIETVEDSGQPKHFQPEWKEKFPKFLFQKHSDQSLLEMGIPAEFLPKLRKLTEINELEAFEEQLPPNLYDKLLNLVWPDTVKKPESTDEEIREQIDKEPNQQELALIDTSQEFDRALAGSIQEWMLFLHPSQRQVVEATYSGPARIKGVAGSGKTVVALHRARFLAKAAPRGQKVLFLTYSNRLAGVAEELITLLCGNGCERAAIEVRTLHSWCKRFLGDSANICKGGDQRRAMSEAIQAVLSKRPESRLRRFSQNFVEDEIGAVIQGRALGHRDTYLALKRIGRGTPLSDDDRQMIFLVYEEYEKLLKPDIDFNDLILLALQKIKTEAPGTAYYGVVVDEIQDLSESAMRLIKEIAAAALHNLLLIGDGQQQIYQAGFSLRETGIEIVGRSRILRQNYRNTKPILESAYSMIKDMEFDDLGDEGAPTKYPPEYASRGGKKPVLRRCSSVWGEQKWLALELQQLLSSDPKLFPGDIAILARTKQKLTAFQNSLRTLGFSTCFLSRDNVKEYLDKGTLKLVTMHSAKGLEFKIVFIVGMSKDEFPFSTSQSNGSMSEDALEREQRLLYVAMTRARDMLYISYCGEPSKFVRQIEPSLVDART